MSPGFAERQFEFCFNFEFMNRYRRALVGIPLIPSQWWEGQPRGGYDVRFIFRHHRPTRSIFFQHKVPKYVEHRAGRNAGVYDLYQGPYYYFYLHRSGDGRYLQHAALRHLRAEGQYAYYTSPRFHGWESLILHSHRGRIIPNTFAVDPAERGPIIDRDVHKVSYDARRRGRWNWHSEPKRAEIVLPIDELVEKLKGQDINRRYFDELLGQLERGLHKIYEMKDIEHISSESLDSREDLSSFHQCAYLIRNYYKLNWILV